MGQPTLYSAEAEDQDLRARVVLPGTCRIKKNSRRHVGSGRKKKVLPSVAYERWEQQARAHVLFMYRVHAKGWPIMDLIAVRVLAYYSGPEPDLSGILESVGDAMQSLLWEDDRQIVSWDGSRKIRVKDDERTVVEVRRFVG